MHRPGPSSAGSSGVIKAILYPGEWLAARYVAGDYRPSFVAEFDGNTNPYVRQYVFHLEDDVPLDQLQRAWDDTIRANPVLRTRICNVQGTRGYMQTVVSEVPILGHFVWTAHHALCDGSSIPEVLEEVAMRFQGKPASIKPRTPFGTFIQLITGLDVEQEQRQLYIHLQLSSIRCASPRNQRPTEYPRLLLLRAAWAILLAHYTGTQVIVFGAINNGRAAPVSGVSRMTGPTIKLVPIALRVDPEQSVAAFLSSVWALSAEMIPFEHMGMSKIRQSLAHRMSSRFGSNSGQRSLHC
ncbi:uncharacterized protein P174DRAFT_425383 [Aspergillus novofumigatus IBT 16806]|uniref:Condensation domain-containing protein n=1 Tax=Aspergillus novofumigatus (strain IBT 16806) TaxID=1392255 RepID=A0A2I1BVQ7_ASPN1|nr:uncharacterized protein P174DRAFT_425383 [Aspergillus novofumigatus IBT 16806]PKX89460.1 hypothetical protein P174DRAFT_425383 [Aspergillus novofumigatus IBT 16806]